MDKLFQLFTLAAAFAALFTGVNGGWDPRSSNMIAGYWGQNSMGTADGQQRLIHYCPSDKIDVILLSFLPSLRNMHSLNFANQEVGPLEHDIQDCQNNHKKSILLSIGGETTSDIGWGTRDEAVKAARDLWAAYGPPTDPAIHRPLGNAIVEGIDIDYEKNIENLLPFAEELRRLTDESSAKDGKKYLVTLAPQCPFPDENLKALLQSDVAWDGVLIQFYNNERCGVISFVPGGEQQERFNLEEWQRWAENSANPNVKILIGTPADSQAGAGYVPGHVLADVIQYSKRFKNFGGLMFW
ncbi:related to CTS1 Endochitinase [Rhynchosporium agropyri]|uniref:Related to CTS1 Endochitinase n=1 Tax=Rhynchosporium agropyri TaxID=914238 RepID=A0A1E1KIF1_9HELO|nr:related to CTS1 Endochitinase [Rhynchosporium agropyri]